MIPNKHIPLLTALLTSVPLVQVSAQSFNLPNRASLLNNTLIAPIVIKPNLTWGSRNTYSLDGPQTREMRIDGFGIDDIVDVFETLEPFTISQDVVNKSDDSEGNYLVNLTIRRMIFMVFGAGIQAVTGWVSSDDPAYEVYSDDISGPPLAPNESFKAEFADIDPTLDFTNLLSARCGLFEATLTCILHR